MSFEIRLDPMFDSLERGNDHVDRVPASTVSKVQNGPSGASVQHFVRCSGLNENPFVVAIV